MSFDGGTIYYCLFSPEILVFGVWLNEKEENII